MHKISFISPGWEFKPGYDATWFHGGRFHIRADSPVIQSLAMFKNPLTVKLSDKWQWELDCETATVENNIISWKYITRESKQ